jgi:hypothetical protein
LRFRGVFENRKLIQRVFYTNLTTKEDDTLLVFGDPAGLHEFETEAEAL